jgi:hypothetical protein
MSTSCRQQVRSIQYRSSIDYASILVKRELRTQTAHTWDQAPIHRQPERDFLEIDGNKCAATFVIPTDKR